MFRNAEQYPEATECHCGTVSLSHLSLDLDEPIGGWTVFFNERGIEVAPDDVGRPSVPRRVLADLLAEHREREARLAERPRPDSVPVAPGRPAIEGLNAHESMIGQPDFVTVRSEFGRPGPNFLDEELAEGRRQAADERAEQEAVERAKQVLDGRTGK